MRIGNTFAALVVVLACGAAAAGQATVFEPGATLRVYDIGESMFRVPVLVEGQTPNVDVLIEAIDLDETRDDFRGFTERFVSIVRARLEPPVAGEYELRLASDDGSKLYLDGVCVIDHDGLHAADAVSLVVALEKRPYALEIHHFEEGGDGVLACAWKRPGAEDFETLDRRWLRTPKGVVRVTSPGRKRALPHDVGRAPGDRRPLNAVHPSYDLVDLRAPGFEPRVGGLDRLPDGRLVLCTWDTEGAVWIVPDGLGAGAGRPPKRIARGLAEPLGLAVADGRIFVLQKQELTELVDLDGDELIDEFRCLADGWSVSSNFHEFAFGLVEKEGWLYFNLAIAIDPGGRSTRPQVPDRGRVARVSIATGELEWLASGLRTPNGIGLGPDGDVYVTDNQGDWLPSSKLLRLEHGAFYNGYAAVPEGFSAPVTPPVVWLPQNEIGNSPSQPTLLTGGPFAGQMTHGDVTHGGLKRVLVERVGDVHQGAVFRFTQGLEAGPNRLVTDDAGRIWVGGIGSLGNWQHAGRRWFGLQRLDPNGAPSFEMRAVSARANGFLVTLTEPLRPDFAPEDEDLEVTSWRYEPSEAYGGPKVDTRRHQPVSVTLAPDRVRLFVELGALAAGRVYHLRLPAAWRSASERAPWSTECWYTVNAVPEAGFEPFPARPAAARPAPEGEGWIALVDGDTTDFVARGGPAFPTRGWSVQDGELVHEKDGGGGDLVTRERYADFELVLDWKVGAGGNSGVFYRVGEGDEPVWATGPEMQVLDDDLHPDGGDRRTSAGAVYGLLPAPRGLALPAGQWNHARVRVQDGGVEHWLNGRLAASYRLEDPAFRALVKASKFRELERFARLSEGRIALQDHGDAVRFRRVFVRRLP